MSDESRSTSKDLVARLRSVESRGERTIWTDAADEIERLQRRVAELDALVKELSDELYAERELYARGL